jgi:hypothetical protein
MPKVTMTRSGASTLSYWDTANAQLDPKIRKSLVNVNIGTGRVIDAVLNEALAKQKAFNLKKWKIVIRGKEVVLSDIFDKIVRWVDHFKVAGDVAVQFNSGAASLPWAAVRFVLQVAMNDQKYLENMIEGIQVVVEMIATYAVVETLYLDPEFDLHDLIRNRVVGLYVHILSFLGEGIEYYQQSLTSKS